MYDTVVAKADSQELLHALMEQKAIGMISEDEYQQSVVREIHAGRMYYTGFQSHRVQLTERQTGNTLLEFRVPGKDELYYAFCKAFR